MTSEEVRLLDISAGGVVASWQCPQGPIAKAAATGACHLLVATGQGRLYLLESSLNGLKCVAETELKDEVACIDIASWTHPGLDLQPLLSCGTVMISVDSSPVHRRRGITATLPNRPAPEARTIISC